MLAAQGNVAVIGAEHNLLAGTNDAAFIVAGVADGFLSAPAYGFDFADFVGDFHQPQRTGEEMELKVCAQTVAQYRNIKLINDAGKKVDFFRPGKLDFIDDDRIIGGKLRVTFGAYIR